MPETLTDSMTMTYREALRLGLEEVLIQDDRVFLMGEDVGLYGGTYAVSKGCLEKFGPERIRDAPLSESAFVGAGIGAAIQGLRPIVEIMTVNFSLLALDQIINNAATLRHMSGGQIKVPIVIRMTTGAGRQLAAQHSHSFEGWYSHIPGLKILTPATLEDAHGMVRMALSDSNPVLIFEYASLFNQRGLLEKEKFVAEYRAAIRRSGEHITVVTYGGCLPKVLAAAEEAQDQGVEAEVIDLRSLRPLDMATVVTSLQKTHRCLVVEESWRSVSLSSEVMARIMEDSFYELDAPVARICSADVPVPYAKQMEEATIPQVSQIREKILEVYRHHV